MKKSGLYWGLAIVMIATGFLFSRADLQVTEKGTVRDMKPEKADQPDMAAYQQYVMVSEPGTGAVPEERLLEAYRLSRKMKREAKGKAEISWNEVSSNMGGRTRALLWDPQGGDGAWAGSVTGGLWYRSDVTDPGTSWTPVNDFWPSLSISCLVADPENPQILYAGTGEYQTARWIYRESSGVGIGIWKSSDGGATWDILESTVDFKYISDLVIRDENGTPVLYAGVVSGYYHGVNHVSEPSDGLYRSTDGGESWEQVLPDIPGETVPFAPADLAVGPQGRIFVGTMKNLDGKGGASILWSDDGTAGSWTLYDDYAQIIPLDPDYPIPGRVIVAPAPSDYDRVYALVGAGWIDGMGANRAEGRYILRSDDGGVTWTEKPLPDNDPGWASLSWHAFAAAVNPSDPDDIFIGGLDEWKSVNGGNSWTHVSDWSLMYSGGGSDYVHADQHIQLYRPYSSTEALFGSDGGVFYTATAPGTNPVFLEVNQGYSTLQFYTCDIYPLEGVNYFVGGLQDNGTLLYQGDPLDINDMIDGGDGAFCFFDEDEPEIMITSVYYNSYTLFMNFQQYNWFGNYGTGIFINPADYDSKNNILYANGVTFSNGNPNRLLRIKNIPDNPNDQLINIGTDISTWFSAIKVSPYAPEGTTTLFAGSADGHLFRVENAQMTPMTTEITGAGFPEAYISSVTLGGSEDTILVTFSNYGVSSVWQSYDGGVSWSDIEGNLPDMPVRWGLYHPGGANNIMLATELGVWTTNDGGEAEVVWEPDPDMPNVRVDMLQLRPSDMTVLAATHGRGLMWGTWNYNPVTGMDNHLAEAPHVFPNPAREHITVTLSNPGKVTIDISTMGGKSLLRTTVSGRSKIDISGLEPGIYLVRQVGKNRSAGSKLIVR